MACMLIAKFSILFPLAMFKELRYQKGSILMVNTSPTAICNHPPPPVNAKSILVEGYPTLASVLNLARLANQCSASI